MKDEKLFKIHFLSHMNDLSRDRIINVRLTLAYVLAQYYRSEGPLTMDKEVMEIVKHLKYDVKDVSEILGEIDVEADEEVVRDFTDEKTNKMVGVIIDSLNGEDDLPDLSSSASST